MPNRIIKESICTSETIDCLSEAEEVCFYRLLVNCDDYGRLDARTAILRARLYPLRMEAMPAAVVESHLAALARHGLICLYTVGRVRYLQVVTWGRHQQMRAARSKYPGPEAAAGLTGSAAIAAGGLFDGSERAGAAVAAEKAGSEGPAPAGMWEREAQQGAANRPVLPLMALASNGNQLLADAPVIQSETESETESETFFKHTYGFREGAGHLSTAAVGSCDEPEAGEPSGGEVVCVEKTSPVVISQDDRETVLADGSGVTVSSKKEAGMVSGTGDGGLAHGKCWAIGGNGDLCEAIANAKGRAEAVTGAVDETSPEGALKTAAGSVGQTISVEADRIDFQANALNKTGAKSKPAAGNALARASGAKRSPVPPEAEVVEQPDFETFYALYPRRQEKERARRAWQARVRAGASPAEMVAAARHYAAECTGRGVEPRYIKLAATFLGPDMPFREWVDGLPSGPGLTSSRAMASLLAWAADDHGA